jgi:stearoyl-CoA desaturase (delta-9 desaturase)
VPPPDREIESKPVAPHRTTPHVAEPPRPGTLPLPEGVFTPPPAVDRIRVRWTYTLSIVGVHLLALLAFMPSLFSWWAAGVCLAGLYVFGTLGVNVCFHRLLTHRSFACPKWVEHTLAILGVCCLQEGPARWVAIHRKHHQQSDEQPDPHSPLVAFFWGHVGWLLVDNRETDSIQLYQRYARDLLSQPFYFRLERRYCWLWVYVAHAVVLGLLAAGVSAAMGADLGGIGRAAASMIVWGVLVRTVLVWHITWSVNSLSHLFGYQSYKTGENSRNNWFVALISNGEGWHNNHHADQRCAAHGLRWYELDVTYLTIRLLGVVGLATKIMKPGRESGVGPGQKA